MEDIQIVELYWERNQLAITESMVKYGTMLKRISLSVLSNHEDSEECVNDTYMKAWNTMPPQKPNSLSAYLGRITRNVSINRWHARHTQKRGGVSVLLSELSDCIPSCQTIETELEASELTAIITRWLYSLPQDDRVLFLRRYWFGESLGELAKECFTTSNKLAGRMYRLRKKLQTTLEREGVLL